MKHVLDYWFHMPHGWSSTFVDPYFALIVNGDDVALHVYFMCFVWAIYCHLQAVTKLQNTINHTNNNNLLLMFA